MGNNPYYYPPWFCLLFVPLTLLPFQVARAAWLQVNLILLFFSLEEVRKALEWRRCTWRQWGACSVATLVFAAYCLRSAQASILLLFGLAPAFNAVRRDRPVMLGLGLTIALTKPQATGLAAVLLGLWLLVSCATWRAEVHLADVLLCGDRVAGSPTADGVLQSHAAADSCTGVFVSFVSPWLYWWLEMQRGILIDQVVLLFQFALVGALLLFG